MKCFKAKLFVDVSKLIFFKARPVLYCIRSKVDNQINKLLGHDIIEPVSFSDWKAPIVPVLKPGKSVRICGDFNLIVNKVCKLDCYPILKIDDLFAKLYEGIYYIPSPNLT